MESMIQENQNLLKHFEALLSELQNLRTLDTNERHARFRAIEARGAFEHNGADIRRFARSPSRTLTPEQFLRRTHLRLINTIRLVKEFKKREAFPQGARLIGEIESMTTHVVDDSDANDVATFKNRVEEIRKSALFEKYQTLKQQFIRDDPLFRTEVEIIAAEESTQENHAYFLSRAAELTLIGDNIESGKLSLEDAQKQLDAIAVST